MPQLSQSAINELLGLIAERRAACAKDGKPSVGLESVQVAFESLMAKGQGSNLFWVRPAEQEHVTAPVVPVLTPVAAVGAATSPACHVVIEGDNFHALQLLQHSHKQAVDIIYIDPPYNTNRGDFRYNDVWVDGENRWKHSLWLSFMEKRLRLAKSLLSKTGLIFIHIDECEIASLRLLMDELFGEACFRNILCWHYENSTMKNPSKKLATSKEFVLIYCSDVTAFEGLQKVRYGEVSDKLLKRFGKYADERGDIRLKDVKNEKSYLSRILPRFKKLNGRAAEDSDVIDSLQPNYLRDYVNIPAYRTSEFKKEFGLEFNNPKPVELVKLLLSLSPARNAVVLDFFAGSGTTAQAVMELNAADQEIRQCILVTNNEVDRETAQKLACRGLNEGAPEWEREGICQSVTWPRVAQVAQLQSSAKSAPRVEYFRLSSLSLQLASQEEGVRLYGAADKAEARAKAIMAHAEQVALFSPVAWLEAGAFGAYSARPAETGHGIGFAVVRKASELPQNPAEPLRVVYLLTDALVEQPGSSLSAAAARVASKFPAGQKVKIKELWIDYMKNFPVEEK